MSTPSLLNAQQTRDFISQHHSSVYAALDPALVNLPSPFNVVIVGGSGAAGTALAKSYALAGASGIVLAARTKSAIEDVAKDVRSINPSLKVVSVGCDTTSNTDVANLADVVRQEFNGHLDVVVQNCGFSGPLAKATIVEEDPTDVQKAFDIHAVGTWLVAHYLLPFLLATESGARSFLAISSIAAPGLIGFGATSHYCASKVAQARLIEIMHAQYSHQGIFCSAVHPGGMQSDFARAASPDIQHRE